MGGKEFHIVSSGVSLITNAQRKGVIDSSIKISDEDYWKSFEKSGGYRKLMDFIESNKGNSCAELSTLLKVSENKDKENIMIYLFGTNTASNEICRKLISDYLNKLGFRLLNQYEVSGYFREVEDLKNSVIACDIFVKDISLLIDRLIKVANKKKLEGYEVYFNPTAGFKAHVISCAIAGFLTGSKIYYKNEEFENIVFLPPLIYIPKDKELEFLNFLRDKHIISSSGEVETLINRYGYETFERLETYGLITSEREGDKVYRIRISEKGKLITKNLT